MSSIVFVPPIGFQIVTREDGNEVAIGVSATGETPSESPLNKYPPDTPVVVRKPPPTDRGPIVAATRVDEMFPLPGGPEFLTLRSLMDNLSTILGENQSVTLRTEGLLETGALLAAMAERAPPSTQLTVFLDPRSTHFPLGFEQMVG
ncbi:hypothetical protein FHX09_001229 [Rhizobium sp. BK538]|nr:hypothetical protein [Rhizobium sp. BK538]